MSTLMRSTLATALGLAALVALEAPAFAGSCHAHAHSHDQCGWHTRSRTKSGGSVSCDANTNTPGVHSHAFSVAECFLFSCNKVVGGHHWWLNGCGPKHAWWHATAGTGRFLVVSTQPVAELELVIPVEPPPETLPPPDGRLPVRDGLAQQGFAVADDAVVNLEVHIAIVTADGRVLPLLEGNATLGGPTSSAPGLSTSDSLARVLRRTTTAEQDPARVARVSVARDFVSAPVRVPTNQELEFRFDLKLDVGGDDPREGEVRDSAPPDGDRLASAASLGATLRLTDRSGRFVLKSLEIEEEETTDDRNP